MWVHRRRVAYEEGGESASSLPLVFRILQEKVLQPGRSQRQDFWSPTPGEMSKAGLYTQRHPVLRPTDLTYTSIWAKTHQNIRRMKIFQFCNTFFFLMRSYWLLGNNGAVRANLWEEWELIACDHMEAGGDWLALSLWHFGDPQCLVSFPEQVTLTLFLMDNLVALCPPPHTLGGIFKKNEAIFCSISKEQGPQLFCFIIS